MLGMVRDDQLRTVPLVEGPLVCVLPKTHILCSYDSISPAELQGQTLIGVDSNIGALVHTAFINTGIPYDPEMEVRYCHTACVLANAGVGATVVDSFSAHFISSSDAQIRPFVPQMNIPAVAVHRRGTPLSRMAEEFIDETRSRLKVTG
jgi:DNA-binding transcriptional LysR family regulator